MVRKPTEVVTLSLRVREELRRRLEAEAKKRRHSLNAEIVRRLASSFIQADQIEEHRRLVDTAAKTVAAALGDAVLAKLNAALAVERAVFDYGAKETEAE
jgi:hypothetical protein